MNMMSNCIFCKIVAGEIPSVKIWENDQFIAIFDAFPASKAQTLVLPKHHYDSNIFVLESDFYAQFMLSAKEVATLLSRGLQVERIGMVVEGLQVPHAHIKLYPFRGGKSFEGGLTGHVLADIKELQEFQKMIVI